MKNDNFIPMAIVGYGCVYPGDVNSSDKLWKIVVDGGVFIGDIPEDRWDWRYYFSEDKQEEDKTYSKLGACIQNYSFNERYYDKFSSELKKMNRIQMMALDTILQCLDKSKYTIEELSKQNVGYLMGNMLGDDLYPDYSLRYHSKEILYYMNHSEVFEALDSEIKEKIQLKLMESISERFPGMEKENTEKYINSTLSYLIKQILKLRGVSCVIDGACSSGVLVIDEAIKLLSSKEMDMCIVTGALGSVNVIGSVGFSKIGGLSPEKGRPLDKNANGLNSSEGIGTIIIKRLSDAIRDNDEVHSVIMGVGSEDDGKGKSIYAPNRKGQCRAMKKALRRAKLTPPDIDYIEVHATGTPTGDIEEMETLKLLFQDYDVEKQSVPIGSIKSQIGHCFSAAGVANLIKVIESMKHQVFPVTWNYLESPKEVHIEDTPFYVNTKSHEWKRKNGVPRRAIVNAFGFGGINSSLIVEEYIEEYHKKLMNKREEKYINYSEIDIAIVGIGVIDNNVKTKEEWFKADAELHVAQQRYLDERFSKEYSEIFSDGFDEACFIKEFQFPWLRFKIPPKVLDQIDRAQPLVLIAADEAIEDYGKEKMEKENVSVYIGKMVNSESASKFNVSVRYVEYVERLKTIDEFKSLPKESQDAIIASIKQGIRKYAPRITEDALPGYMDNIVSGRLSNFYNLKGTSAVIDSGSNSFLVALKQGIHNLITGESDSVLVGGIHANMTPEFLNSFQIYQEVKGGILDRVPSEGTVFFVIKRSKDITPEDKVYAKIKALIDEDLDSSCYSAQYLNSCQNLITDKGCKMNYFGAQMCFEMLDAIRNVKNNNFDRFIPLNEYDHTGMIKVMDTVYFSNQYAVYMTVGDKDAKVYRLETETTSDDKVQAIYLGGVDWEDIKRIASRVTCDNYLYYASQKQIENYAMKVAITFSSIEELERKLKFVKM